MTPAPDKNIAQPAITILIAAFNRLELLRNAVNSALDQQYSNFGILIVDDGSEAEVVEWLRELESGEPRVSVIYLSHRGVAAARATGLEQARTDLVCILDSDDLLSRDALANLAAAMSGNADTQLVFSNIREVRSNGEAVTKRYRQYRSTRAMTLATLLKPRLPFKHSGTLFRRQTALALGSYDVKLPCKIDVDLYLKFLQAGYLPRHLDQALVDFRMHKDSLSMDRLTGIRVWLCLIDRYGPPNPVYRLLIKGVRISAELMKRLYMEMRG